MKGDKAIRRLKYLVFALTQCLEATEIPYVIVGGITIGAYGIGRSTEDVDVLIQLDASNTAKIQLLSKCFEEQSLSVTTYEITKGLQENSHITVFDTLNPMLRIDLSPISTNTSLETFKNRVEVDLFGDKRGIWINSPETLIAIKLSPGFHSEQDVKDAKGILLRSGKLLDWKKLESLCDYMNCANRLRELRNEISKYDSANIE
ncbi:MAG: hypothetical protein ACE5OZ_20675 [Candidatus Heimdallarchaeota archaeon]